MKRHRVGVDVPVLLIFWTRDSVFKRVFEQVKLARPSRLFLYQDGPREDHPADAAGLHRCRTIAEDVDWDCEVQRFYQKENMGCDPSEFVAIKWAFDHVDRCIILEDDDVPSRSFFPFCRELLEKYSDDQRINMICGLNHRGISTDCPHDYLFTTSGAITGWASWKRTIDSWEEHLDYLDDDYARNVLEKAIGKEFIDVCGTHRASGRAHYESILGASCFLNNRLNIVPKKNMISNIGVVPGATHGATSMDLLPRGIRRIFNMGTHEVAFPLRHPKYVVNDIRHKKEVDRILGNGHPWIQRYRHCESVVRRCIAGDVARLIAGIKKGERVE